MKTQGNKDDRWKIDPPDDVRRMVVRAMKDIAGPNWNRQRGLLQRVVSDALRASLRAKYARKKDLTESHV